MEDSDDTIFIIEIAVLTVFGFACLSVIITSLCLIKMRQSTKAMSKRSGSLKSRPNKHSVPVQIYKTKPPASYTVVDINKILSHSSAEDEELQNTLPLIDGQVCNEE